MLPSRHINRFKVEGMKPDIFLRSGSEYTENRGRCRQCPEYRNCRDSFVSWIFFIIGIIATIAVRVVTVLIHLGPVYARAAWYIGVGGFFVFFIYKYKVGQARARVLAEHGLVEKINAKKNLSQEDYRALSALLCSVQSRKERINYFFIFGLSAAALLLAVYMDFLHKG